MVDKQSHKIVKLHKDMVVCQLTSLGVKVLAVIASISDTFWDVLVPTTEDGITLTKKSLENKEYTFRTKYIGPWQTMVSI